MSGRVLALSGGVGGAKLALGLLRVIASDELIVVANTGDDFEHLGLAISPDLDTLVYTLAGLDNPDTGWGRRDETWTFMAALETLGGPTWFRLGDGDLAMHVERTQRLHAGESLSTVTEHFRTRLGIRARVMPMSDNPVRTMVRTSNEWLAIQDWFVRLAWQPDVTALRYDGASGARPHPALLGALADPALAAVVVCPSNPFVSIDPILAIPGVRDALSACRAPRIAVSPIIGGRAVKGPTAKMMRGLGLVVEPAAVAAHYAGLIDGMVVDHEDARCALPPGVVKCVTATFMQSLEDRERLARDVLAFADHVRR